MLIDYQLTQTSIILRVKLRQDTTGSKPGYGFTGLSNTTSGLNVATIADTESSTTNYTSSGSTIQTISTLGTYSAPTSGDCRFAKVDDTNHPGICELHLANGRYGVSNAKSLLVSITGVSGMMDCDVVIPLRSVNPYDGVRGGMGALPSAAVGSGANSFNLDGSGNVKSVPQSGTITTVTGNVNGSVNSVTTAITLPSIPSNWITAAGINAGALNGKGDWLLASSAPSNFSSFNVDGSGRVLLQPTQTGVTIPTVTTLTNLPAIPNNWLTASGIASSAMNGKGDWLLTSSVPANFGALSIDSSGRMTVAPAGLDSVAIESGIAASSALTNDAGSQLTSINLRQAIALMLAVDAALVSGATTGSSTITYEQTAVPNGEDRIVGNVDVYGNRTSLTLKVPI